ncbi:MAG: accessory gene regulator B family protein [Anaerocolumna sp.]
METSAHNLAGKISLEMHFNEDKEAVIAYGLTAIFQLTTIFVVISIIGLIFHFWFECIIIFLGVGIIRKSTGGAHSETMYGCIIISVLSVIFLASLSKYLFDYPIAKIVDFGISIFIYAFCFIIFYIRVPVDSPNKPIVRPEKIKRLRRQSFIILTILFIIAIALIILSSWNNRLYSIAVSLRLTMLWQVFTLTGIGSQIFGKIDSKIKV